MAFNPKQFRKFVADSLMDLDPKYCTEPARELLLLTCAQESNFGTYLWQAGGGPALGVFQMEPRTYDDIHTRMIKKRFPGLAGSPAERMVYDLRFAVQVGRIFYLQFAEPIPADLQGMAEYYKKYWNTKYGAATVEEALRKYRYYVGVE